MPPKPRQNVFGPFLVELRKERGKRPLTQEELANVLGMSRSTLANIENGRRLPTGEFLVMLADLFHTSRYDRTELLRTLQIKALIQRYPELEELLTPVPAVAQLLGADPVDGLTLTGYIPRPALELIRADTTVRRFFVALCRMAEADPDKVRELSRRWRDLEHPETI